MRRAATSVLLVALAFIQSPGLIAPDTKLDLTTDPIGFLGRATELWDPNGFGGQVQNQAYGYLFPIGPFFALGDVVGLPPWVVQRLWWSVVLVVAFLGVTTLARHLRIGSPLGQLVAGLAFALSPRIMSTLGPVSAETWPMALAPWVVVPLVIGSWRGDYRRCALGSALVVALMGGVNAALVLAAITPAGLYLVTRQPGRRSWRLLGWWLGSVTAAVLWWLVPLVVLGHYSPPFLDYIETADVTTTPTSLIEVLRGTSHWVAYLGPGLGSSWRAGHELVVDPVLIVDTVLVAAVGLAGLCLRGLRERSWLVCMLLVGVVIVTFGHVGDLHAPFALASRHLLDGPLAPLRNLHKFDPLIRLALVLGLAHAVSVLPSRVPRLQGSQVAVGAAIGALVVAVLGSAGPALAGRVSPDGAFHDIPPYWSQAAAWLGDHPSGRALLVPGTRFAVYTWGSPMDEPLQVLATTPWEVRNAIPLVPPGHIRFLDQVEQMLRTGQPSAGLSGYLSAAGIGYLVVRNDLVPARTTTPALAVDAVLRGSPGLSLAATFGPDVVASSADRIFVDGGLRSTPLPAVEIWAVSPTPTDVSTNPTAAMAEVVGGPESLLGLGTAGLLPDGQTILAAQQSSAAPIPNLIITDGMQRREVDFGLAPAGESRVLSATEPYRLDRPEHDYAVSSGDRWLTVARWDGVDDVQVSSSLADVDALPHDIAAGPAAAFDESPSSAWLARSENGVPVWLRVTLDHPTVVPRVEVALSAPQDIAEAALVTDRGRQELSPGDRSLLTFDLGRRPISRLTIELTPRDTSPVGVSDLRIDGVEVWHSLQVPTPPAGSAAPNAIYLSVPDGHRDGCLVNTLVLCTPGLGAAGEEDPGLHRTFTLSDGADYDLSASAAAVPGGPLDSVIAAARGGDLAATASSSTVPDPLGSALAATDGTRRTGWVAAPGDPDPALMLSWSKPRRVSGGRVSWNPGLPASQPTRVAVDLNGHTYVRRLVDGAFTVPTARASAVTVHLLSPRPAFSYDEVTQQTSQLPMGVSEITVAGLHGGPLLGSERDVLVPCGSGPPVVVDGRTYPTRVETTVDTLARLASVPLTVCGDQRLPVSAATHRVDLDATALWRPIDVALVRPDWPGTGAPASGEAAAGPWGASSRTASVGERPDPGVLSLTENTNRGWHASLDGSELDPVVVNGWQQGFALPGGPAGTVQLSFGPQIPYLVGLLAGVVTLLLLLVGVRWLPAARRHPPAAPLRLRRRTTYLLGAGALAAVAGVAGLAVAAAVVVARWVLTSVVRQVAWLDLAWASAAAVALTAGGALLAVAPWGSERHEDLGSLVQVCCLVAVAMVASGPLRPRRAAASDEGHVEAMHRPRDQDAAREREDEDVTAGAGERVVAEES